MRLKGKMRRKDRVDYRNILITSRKPKSPASEAFRTLRMNIEFSSFEKEIKTLLITSTQPAEGKSTVAANLCTAMTMVGKKVLLVDADFRMPSLHQIFDFENSKGLTSLIMNPGSTPGDVVQETGIENLSLLASGPTPPNPAELLASTRMRKLFAGLTEVYDAVVVDSPPLLAVSDAAILASYLDGVILVLGAGRVSRDQARTARDQLQKAKAHVLGVVLNRVPVSGSGYYYPYC